MELHIYYYETKGSFFRTEIVENGWERERKSTRKPDRERERERKTKSEGFYLWTLKVKFFCTSINI